MPRYFFDIQEKSYRFVDEEGLECDTLDEAEIAARRAAAEIMLHQICDAALNAIVIEVREETGLVATTVTVSLVTERDCRVNVPPAIKNLMNRRAIMI